MKMIDTVACLIALDLDFRSGESHLMACKTPPIYMYFTFSGSGLILKVSICMKCQIFCSTTFYLI